MARRATYDGVVLFLSLIFCAGATTRTMAQKISLGTAVGGFAVSGAKPAFLAGFGSVNGLGAGAPAAGISATTSGVTGGALYTTNYNIVVTASGSLNAVVMAYISLNFLHPAVLKLESCYPAASCASASSFSALSTSSLSPTAIIPTPGVRNGTFTASLGLFVANVNGGGAYSGTDTATITFLVYGYDSTNNTLTLEESDTLTLSSPLENVQNVVQLTLASASGGLTISPANDYSANYGTVNGLGIFPASGLTVLSASGGVIYSTPYVITPSFSGFSSTTATVNAYVSSNFAHSATLKLEDATSSSGPYSAISTSSVAPTVFTTTASSNSAMTRYLGLFTSNSNGGSAFSGSDTATLTYTLTVP